MRYAFASFLWHILQTWEKNVRYRRNEDLNSIRLLPRPWGSQNGMHDDTGRHKRLASGEDKNIWNTFLAPEQHCICNQRKRLSPCRSVQKRFFLFFYNNEFNGCWLSSKAEKSVFNLLVSHFMDVRSYCLGAFRGFLTAKKRYWKRTGHNVSPLKLSPEI